jgi:hypothetical protein
MALRRVAILSPNYSARNSDVWLIVLHTAEGALTYQSLGAYFQNPNAGVSSHVGIDDTPGTVGEYVFPAHKAWTQANANPFAVSAELCAFASWSASEWDQHRGMLDNAAEWIAEESARFGIPIRRLNASQAQSGVAGVCQHVDLGAMGGNHWDCGPGFPMDRVLAMASGGTTAPVPESEDNMVLADPDTGGYWVAFRDGAVHAYKGAPYLGNAMEHLQGHAVIGIAAHPRGGYTLASDFGNKDVRFFEYPR